MKPAMDEASLKRMLQDAEDRGLVAELRANWVFEGNGWSIEPNAYFLDRDEGKGREIDLVGKHNASTMDDEFREAINYTICVSIKNNRTHPWIISTSRRLLVEDDGIFVDAQGHIPVGPAEFFSLKDHPILKTERVGRGARVGKAGSDSEFFSATVTAVKACIQWIEASKNPMVFALQSHGKRFSRIAYCHGLVVLFGRLIECYLNEDGEAVCQETQCIPFVQPYLSANYQHSRFLVDIVQFDFLKAYLQQRTEWAAQTMQRLKTYVRDHAVPRVAR